MGRYCLSLSLLRFSGRERLTVPSAGATFGLALTTVMSAWQVQQQQTEMCSTRQGLYGRCKDMQLQKKRLLFRKEQQLQEGATSSLPRILKASGHHSLP